MRFIVLLLLFTSSASAQVGNTYPYVDLFDLQATLVAVSSKVQGVSAPNVLDKATWVVDWSSEPTAQEQADVAAAIAAYDASKLVRPPVATVDKLVQVLLQKGVITPADMK